MTTYRSVRATCRPECGLTRPRRDCGPSSIGETMSELTLTDLDELILTVRDRNSRAYISEAVATYRARAYRAAIMSTWAAVAYDIIAKIRELAAQGDGAAK